MPAIGKELTFNQTLDHFNSSSTETFPQRYYVNDTFSSKASGFLPSSLLVYIGGEMPLEQSSIDHLAPIILAKKLNCTILGLEHRFFGNSTQLELTNENLRLLTIEQALADLANFIIKMGDKYCNISTCKIGVIGGSYPGALSSWFRLLYPHIADVSWASSAPVEAKNDFTEYDEHCANVILNRTNGTTCLSNTKKAFQYLQEGDKLEYERKAKLFIGDDKPPEDRATLYYMVADSLATAVQYTAASSYLDDLCKNMSTFEQKDNDDVEGMLEVLADITKNINEQTHQSFWDSDLTKLTNTSFHAPTKDMRAWNWITCNQVGWFQTASGKLRSTDINLDYFDRVCHTLYNISIPNTDQTNLRLGGKRATGTSTIFVNGDRDPWSTMSITESDISLNRRALIVKEGAHCDDLRRPNGTDSESLKNMRNYTIEKMTKMLLMYKCVTKHGYEVLGSCVCNEGFGGEFCDEPVPTKNSFQVVTVASVIVPTFLLLIIGGIVWVCGKKEDSDFGARPALYT